MNVRAKLFTSMMALVIFTGILIIGISQGYLSDLLENPQNYTGKPERYFHFALARAQLNGVLISIVCALIVGLWLTKKLTSPLQQLIKAIERIAKNDLTGQLQVTTRDEYGKVAHALNYMTKELVRTEEVRKHLVADVAHELRTPLMIISGQLELMQESGQPIAPEKLLPMQDEVIRLTQLVNDLHQLSLAEAGRLRLDKQTIDLYTVIKPIVEIFEYELDEKQLEVDMEPTGEPAVVHVDRHRITQVFMNLINNAVQYSKEGGKISISMTKSQMPIDAQTYLCVSITDQGIGIAPEQIAHLFNRFYRVEDTRSRNTGGTGLGLAIAKEFVEAHQGYITVQSKLDEGTTFNVFLPL
jgi:two-component system sensor histidine kinase BaeS